MSTRELDETYQQTINNTPLLSAEEKKFKSTFSASTLNSLQTSKN